MHGRGVLRNLERVQGVPKSDTYLLFEFPFLLYVAYYLQLACDFQKRRRCLTADVKNVFGTNNCRLLLLLWPDLQFLPFLTVIANVETLKTLNRSN